MKQLKTSESVRRGHPDLVADAISEAVVAYVLQRDKKARVACEAITSKNVVILSGEISTELYIPFGSIS